MWSPAIAEQLRARRHDVEAVAARCDLRAASDGVIFAAAIHEWRAVVTENVPDFRWRAIEAIRAGRQHPGLIFTLRSSYRRGDRGDVGRLLRDVHQLLLVDRDLTNLEIWL